VAKYKRFYGGTDEEILKMPAKRFFTYVGLIRKLQAEEMLLLASTIGSILSGEEGQTFIDTLSEDAGITRAEEHLDPLLLGNIGIRIEEKK
jgi:hypothetical protein